jgi:hypothetical protein
MNTKQKEYLPQPRQVDGMKRANAAFKAGTSTQWAVNTSPE